MKYYLTAAICIKTIFPKDILDWFLWHRFLGVEHFYIFDDGCEPDLKSFLSPYDKDITYVEPHKDDLLEQPFIKGDTGDRSSNRQRRIYDRIITDHRNESQWMIFIDEDEYIIPLNGDSLIGSLKNLENFSALELSIRNFSPQGYYQPPNAERHLLDCYNIWYPGEHVVKSIINCEVVDHVFNIHRISSGNAVDAWGKKLDPPVPRELCFGDTGHGKEAVEILTENPDFVINHYPFRSKEHLKFRIERGSMTNLDPQTQVSRIVHNIFHFTNPWNSINGWFGNYNFALYSKLRNDFLKVYNEELKLYNK
tara:strand:+ start:2487 stop:3413 length:927 start_codon:yes stop_codon:yes gene_type:complete